MQEAWEGFKEGIWTGEVDVRDFIQKNYTPYDSGHQRIHIDQIDNLF